MAKLTHKELIDELKGIGVINQKNELLSFNKFKGKTLVQPFGKQKKIIFMGIPNKSLFGFYLVLDSDINMLKEAYTKLNKLFYGEMTDYNDDCIQYGKCGIPTKYANLK
jgi:hypothetical protein